MNRAVMLDEHRLLLLLNRYADGVITSAELAELEDVLRCSPAARDRFWQELSLNALLRTWGEGEAQGLEARPEPTTSRQELSRHGWRGLILPRLRSSFPARFAALAVAATVLVALAWIADGAARRWPAAAGRPHQPTDVAVITGIDSPTWDGPDLSLGQALGPKQLRLESGEVTLGLVSGAQAVIRGPAEFSVRSGLRLQLLAGSLSVRVPPEAEGFIVDAPSVDVVDLGTEFGVRSLADGASDVRVFKGRVETRAGTSPDGRIDLLTANMARRFLMSGASEAPNDDHGAVYPVLPADGPDVPHTTGAIHLLAAKPATLAGLRSDQFMLLFREAGRMRLPAGLPLDITAPGIYSSPKSIRARSSQPGRVVDSYLIHFKARSQFEGNDAEGLVLDGAVTFPGPVIGIACLQGSLDAGDQLAGPLARTASGVEYRGLEFGAHDQDQVVLSTDRRTLWVSLRVSAFTDQIRVFVEPAG